MFVLMYSVVPIGTGTEQECKQFKAKLLLSSDKIQSKHFLIITLKEYEEMIKYETNNGS